MPYSTTLTTLLLTILALTLTLTTAYPTKARIQKRQNIADIYGGQCYLDCTASLACSAQADFPAGCPCDSLAVCVKRCWAMDVNVSGGENAFPLEEIATQFKKCKTDAGIEKKKSDCEDNVDAGGKQ